jgi:hypothetical protein
MSFFEKRIPSMNHFDLAHTMGNQSPFKKLQRNPLRFLGLVLGLSGSLLLARCKKPSRSSDEDYVSQIMNAPEIPTDQGRDFKDPNSPSPGNKVARGQGRGQASGDSEHNKIQDDEQELKASRQTTEITPEIMPPGQQVPPQEQASKNPEPPLPPLPTIQAPGIKNVTLLTKTSNLSLVDSLEISWNGVPGASHYLLLVTSGKEPLFKPQNGSTYDTGIQGSEKILYVGSGTKFVYGGTGKFSEGFSLFVWSVHEAKVYSTKPEQVTFKPCNTLDGGQWVALPGDAAFGTSGFCVQKYPAVNSGELPMSLPMKAPWMHVNAWEMATILSPMGSG